MQNDNGLVVSCTNDHIETEMGSICKRKEATRISARGESTESCGCACFGAGGGGAEWLSEGVSMLILADGDQPSNQSPKYASAWWKSGTE